jgi:aryl-alcohol dehydrogenase-like predicted oxidoreductase
MGELIPYREMFFQPLGRSGLKVSDVGLGTWKFGYPGLGDRSRVPADQALAILDRAAEIGCLFWDTADRYNFGTGNCERILGEWFRGNPSERTNIVIATKVFGEMNGTTPNHEGLSRRHIVEGVEHCLDRLCIDRIDLLQFHQFDAWTPIEESIRTVDDLIHQGLIQYWGVSNFTLDQVRDYLSMSDQLLATRMISVQNAYNLIEGERGSKKGVMSFCGESGLGFLPWSPLARGMLTDRYLDASAVGPGDRLYDDGELEKMRNDRSLGIVRVLQGIGAQHGKTIAQTALGCMLTMPGMGCVIPSASSVSQLEQNCGASGFRLTADEMAAVVKACAV